MRYYAHYGHKDFVLCLGYRGDMIREYFLKYDECMTNDFTMQAPAAEKVELHSSDASDWNITFVDTGLHSNIGQRLLRVRKYLERRDRVSRELRRRPVGPAARRAHRGFPAQEGGREFRVGAFLAQLPRGRGRARTASSPPWARCATMHFMINGGFFALRSEIFDYINEGDELVEAAVCAPARKAAARDLQVHGFWQAMDTFKDKIAFDRMEAKGECPWKVWI